MSARQATPTAAAAESFKVTRMKRILAISFCLVLCLLTFVGCGKDGGEEKDPSGLASANQVKEGNYYIDADYKYDGNDKLTCGKAKLSDLKVPFIKLESEFADKINGEIEQFYYDACDLFSECAKSYDKEKQSVGLSYSCAEKDGIFSVAIFCNQYDDEKEDTVYSKVYTACFNVSDGSKVDYEQFFNTFNYAKSEAEAKIEKFIIGRYNSQFVEGFDIKRQEKFIAAEKKNFFGETLPGGHGYYFNEKGEALIVVTVNGELIGEAKDCDYCEFFEDYPYGYVEDGVVGSWAIFGDEDKNIPLQSVSIDNSGFIQWDDTENGIFYTGRAATDGNILSANLELYDNETDKFSYYTVQFEIGYFEGDLMLAYKDGDKIPAVEKHDSFAFRNNNFTLNDAWQYNENSSTSYLFVFYNNGSLEYTKIKNGDYVETANGFYTGEYYNDGKYDMSVNFYIPVNDKFNCDTTVNVSYDYENKTVKTYSADGYDLLPCGKGGNYTFKAVPVPEG